MGYGQENMILKGSENKVVFDQAVLQRLSEKEGSKAWNDVLKTTCGQEGNDPLSNFDSDVTAQHIQKDS